jgi:protein-tyrosine kinase
MGKFSKAIAKSKKEKGGSKDGPDSGIEAKAPKPPERTSTAPKPERPAEPDLEKLGTFDLGSIHSLLDEAREIEFPGMEKTSDVGIDDAPIKTSEGGNEFAGIHQLVGEVEIRPSEPVHVGVEKRGDEKPIKVGAEASPDVRSPIDESLNLQETRDIESTPKQRDEEYTTSRDYIARTEHESVDEDIIELEESNIIEESSNNPVPGKTDNQIKPTTVESQKQQPFNTEPPTPVRQEPAEPPDNKIIPLRNKTAKGLLLRQYDEESLPAKTSEETTPQSVLQGISFEKVDPSIVTILKPRSFEAEQFKMLRTNLMFPISGQPPRSLLVTSALPGDGKSFVTANLAVSFAMNMERHVLVIDADIRKPEIHSRFGLEARRGLSDFLTKNTPLSKLLMRTSLPNLTILPGGKPPHNPSELLSSEKMPKLLKEVTTRYADRYVIIDSPPPKLTAETGVLARLVDGILLVIRAGETRREMVEELVELVGRDKILGIVLNHYNVRPSRYYGYGRYGSYGKSYNQYYNK